jgi:hypothetical protein
MRAAALATLLLPLALSSPFYEPVSSNPSEWDPSHPPAAALLYPEHDRKGSSRLTEDKDSDDDNGTVWDLSSTELSAWQWPAYLTA